MKVIISLINIALDNRLAYTGELEECVAQLVVPCTEIFTKELNGTEHMITPSSPTAERKLLAWCKLHGVEANPFVNAGKRMLTYELSSWCCYINYQIVATGAWTIPQLTEKNRII